MAINYSDMSMIEVAEHLMLRKKTPQSFRKIAQEVSELMGMSNEELRAKINRFYSDLTLSGKFVNVTGDKWDLKNRQKYEVYEHQFVFDDDNEIDDDLTEVDNEEEDLDEEDIEEEYDEDYEDEEEVS